MTDLPIETLLAGDPDARAAAAETIRRAASHTPGRLRGSLGRVTDALTDDHDPVRRSVAATLDAVAREDPDAVAPVSEALVAALDDDATAVRVGAARSLAAIAADRPQRVRFAVADVVPSLTDVDRVSASVARLLASLAPVYPEVVHEHVDDLTRALLDDYHPVQTAVLTALTALERAYPGLLDVAADRLRDLVTSDVAAVRQAAARAVAVSDPPWARSALTDRVRTDPHPVVRETARDALAALTAPPTRGPTDARGVDAFATVDHGSWVAVRPGREHQPTFLVGRVTGIVRERSDVDAERERTYGVRRADFDDRDAWLAAPRVEPTGDRVAVHLHDPARNRGITLVTVQRGIGAEYTAPGEDVPALSVPAEIRVVPADLAHLLGATPGDSLSFALEGAAHEITVTDAGERDGVYRVAGHNAERGYRISFRPLSNDPLMAVFEKGRAFRATGVSLTAGG